MPVSSFECQIARGQIGRYLDGGVLSPQAMKGLEEHLAECPDCKALVARRRAELLGQLGGETPTHAVVAMPRENPLVAALRARAEEPAPTAPKPASAPRYADKEPPSPLRGRGAGGEGKASRPRWKGEYAEKAVSKEPRLKGRPGATRDRSVDLPNPSPPAPSTPGGRGGAKGKAAFGKPVALLALLSFVLIGMSYVTRGNGGKGVLGARASETFAAQRFADTTPKVEAPAPTETPAPKPAVPQLSKEPSAAVEKPKETVPAVKKEEPKAIAKPSPVKPKVVAEAPLASSREKAVASARTLKKPSKPVVRRRAAPRPARKAATPTVRVYAPDGKPLSP